MDTTQITIQSQYTDRKFIARVKNSPYFLLLTWNKYPSEEHTGGFASQISFHYQMPDPDLGNISMYAARNLIEEDICYAALEGLDATNVEIVEVEVSYTVKIN